MRGRRTPTSRTRLLACCRACSWPSPAPPRSSPRWSRSPASSTAPWPATAATPAAAPPSTSWSKSGEHQIHFYLFIGRYELLSKILLNIMPMPILITKTMMHIAGTSRWRARMLSRGGHCCDRCYRESQHSCTARESGSEPWMLRNNLEHKLIMKTPFNLDTRHPVQASIRTLSISYRDDNREI